MSAPAPLTYPLSGLLGEPVGSERSYEIHGATIALPDYLHLTEPIDGRVRVSRTNRGVFVDGELATSIAGACSRCLREIHILVRVKIREEVLPSIDLATGKPVHADEPDVARLTSHHELDLARLAGEAIALNEPIAPLCEPRCPGLCIACGERLGPGHAAHPEDDIDPRLAALQGFRVDGGGESE